MFGRIILWSSLWVVLLCEWLPMRNEAKCKKNLILGVTIPKEAREDAAVLAIVQEFRRQMNGSCLFLAILSVAGVFLSDLTVSLLCWTAMLVVVMVLPVLIYACKNRRLKALKKERGWSLPRKETVRVDTRAMMDYPKPKPWGYLVFAALCLLPMLLQRSLWWVHLLDLGIALMSYVLAVFCYRKKSETVDDDAERAKALSLIRYRKWKQVWLLCACCGTTTSYSLWAMELSPMLGLSLVAVTSVCLAAAVIGLEMQTRKQQEQLTQDSGTGWYADEDDCWLGGMFYCNPNDSHTLVNARTGVGTTVNLATSGGKLLTIFTSLLVAGSLLLVAALAVADKSEIRLECDSQTISCENGSTEYEISLDELQSVELLDQLPEGMWRNWGTGGQYLIKGRFSAVKLPQLSVIADPTPPPFLLLRTEDGSDYLFGSRDPLQTRQLFEQLSALLSSEKNDP